MWATVPRLSAIQLERVMGIEPTSSAWKAEVLPLNYTRIPSLRLRSSSQYLLCLFDSSRTAAASQYRATIELHPPILNQLVLAPKCAFLKRARILTVLSHQPSGFRNLCLCLPTKRPPGFDPVERGSSLGARSCLPRQVLLPGLSSRRSAGFASTKVENWWRG